MRFTTKPRIMGLVLLVIGILGYLAQKENSILFGIAGIILLIAPTKHTSHMLELFINTFKRWKTIIITALYDALYWLFIYGTVYFLKWQLQKAAANAQAKAFLSGAITPETAGPTANALQGFVFTIFGGAALAFILCLLVYTLARGMMWSTIADKKPDKKLFIKMLGANAGWWAIWGILFLLIALGGKNNPAAQQALLGLLVIATYFTPIMHTLFIKTRQIGYSISNGIAWGIARVHKFIIPYIFALIVLLIMFQPFRLVQNTAYLQPASMLFVVIFFAWLKIYIYDIVKEFEEIRKLK